MRASAIRRPKARVALGDQISSRLPEAPRGIDPIGQVPTDAKSPGLRFIRRLEMAQNSGAFYCGLVSCIVRTAVLPLERAL